ncbi:MAG: hypothetical protein GY888_23705 [Planctomycetaceae bacterium]|nr:hypothetical protein [Planctomycetaceae bacterium]
MASNTFGANLTNKAGTGPSPQVHTVTAILRNAILTAAGIDGGVCRVVTADGDSTNVTDTAANIITALKINQGDRFQFTCVPNNASNTIIVQAGTGVTLAAGQLNATVAGGSITYSGLRTGPAAITLTRIG